MLELYFISNMAWANAFICFHDAHVPSIFSALAIHSSFECTCLVFFLGSVEGHLLMIVPLLKLQRNLIQMTDCGN